VTSVGEKEEKENNSTPPSCVFLSFNWYQSLGSVEIT